jgi:crossover junction endodeoxyribonuclease RuvC
MLSRAPDRTALRILGVDPGLNTSGYAVIERSENRISIVEAGIVSGGPAASADLGARLQAIHEGIAEILAGFQPAALAIEELYSHYERPQTAILMGHARGVICLAASQAGIPIRSYASTQVKRILTGNGRAPKTQIQSAICREFGLRQAPEPPDVADALAIALCHLHLARDLAAT